MKFWLLKTILATTKSNLYFCILIITSIQNFDTAFFVNKCVYCGLKQTHGIIFSKRTK